MADDIPAIPDLPIRCATCVYTYTNPGSLKLERRSVEELEFTVSAPNWKGELVPTTTRINPDTAFGILLKQVKQMYDELRTQHLALLADRADHRAKKSVRG